MAGFEIKRFGSGLAYPVSGPGHWVWKWNGSQRTQEQKQRQ
jgi:hypothetical protein